MDGEVICEINKNVTGFLVQSQKYLAEMQPCVKRQFWGKIEYTKILRPVQRLCNLVAKPLKILIKIAKIFGIMINSLEIPSSYLFSKIIYTPIFKPSLNSIRNILLIQ